MSSKENTELAQVYFYLLLGQEGNCYTAGVKQFNHERLPFIDNLLKDGKGPEIVKEVQKFNRNCMVDRDAKLFVLAQCARSSDLKTKELVYSTLPSVCETGEDVLTFVHFSEHLSKNKGGTGWGRAQRKAIGKWYNDKSPKELAETCTKFASRHGWTHRDVLRLGHVKTNDKATAAILKYLSKGLEETIKEFDGDDVAEDVAEVLSYLKAVNSLKHTKDEQAASYLISKYNLSVEVTPTLHRKHPEIWRALLPGAPLSKILTHLRRFAQLGFLSPHSSVLPLVLEQLRSSEKLAASNLQPVDVFLALKKYEELSRPAVAGMIRPVKRRLNTAVVDALHSLFVTSLQHVTATGKRFLVAVDVRNPMVHSKVQGCPQLTPALASALLILPLLHVENLVTVTAFSTNDLRVLDLKKDMNLLDITKRMRETPMGPVNCLRPLVWAKQANKPFDAFLILTDNQIQMKPDDVKPADALRQYRQALNVPQARLIVCALTMKRFSFSSLNDSGMLDIGGFDAQVPHIIRNFVQAPL